MHLKGMRTCRNVTGIVRICWAVAPSDSSSGSACCACTFVRMKDVPRILRCNFHLVLLFLYHAPNVAKESNKNVRIITINHHAR